MVSCVALSEDMRTLAAGEADPIEVLDPFGLSLTPLQAALPVATGVEASGSEDSSRYNFVYTVFHSIIFLFYI